METHWRIRLTFKFSVLPLTYKIEVMSNNTISIIIPQTLCFAKEVTSNNYIFLS